MTFEWLQSYFLDQPTREELLPLHQELTRQLRFAEGTDLEYYRTHLAAVNAFVQSQGWPPIA